MPEMTLGFQLSPDNKTLTISTQEDTHRLAYVVATSDEVEKLIQTLAGFRQRMIPEVPRALPDGQMTGELDPLWVVPTHPTAPDKVIVIRHFGMGWLSFFLPATSARLLGHALLGRTSPQSAVQPGTTDLPH